MRDHKLWRHELRWLEILPQHGLYFRLLFLPHVISQSFSSFARGFSGFRTRCLSNNEGSFPPVGATLQLIMRHVDSFFPRSQLATMLLFIFSSIFPISTSTFGGVELDAIYFVKEAAPADKRHA